MDILLTLINATFCLTEILHDCRYLCLKNIIIVYNNMFFKLTVQYYKSGYVVILFQRFIF